MRRDYIYPPLNLADLATSPIEQFDKWFIEATQISRRNFFSRLIVNILGISEIHTTDVNAMILSTVDENRQPSSRVVLLKEFSEKGLVFFGNYQSRKFLELEKNPLASLLFFWQRQMRQVRFEGVCEKITPAQSDEYFNSRPYDSKIGAWASAQSFPINSREDLEKKVTYYKQQFPQKDQVPRPEFWGGYRLLPHQIEFWQGREDRLHDRFVYLQTQNLQNHKWQIKRLCP